MMEWKIGFYLFNHYDGIKFTQGVYLKSDSPHLLPPPKKKIWFNSMKALLK